MKFPWNKYYELSVQKRKTIQIFITNDCNLRCDGCFARNIIDGDKSNMSLDEYKRIVDQSVQKGVERITLVGGEPLKHPEIREMINYNNSMQGIKTTIYTNGYYLDEYTEEDLGGATIRISLYCKSGSVKSAEHLPKTNFPIDICFMVSSTTTTEEVVETANFIGGKIIQCPFDIVNKKFQKDYQFGVRDCQHNSTCLMSKINVKSRHTRVI